jgi:hypothetical protein
VVCIQEFLETFEHQKWLVEMNEDKNGFGIGFGHKFVFPEVFLVGEFGTCYTLGPFESFFHGI